MSEPWTPSVAQVVFHNAAVMVASMIKDKQFTPEELRGFLRSADLVHQAITEATEDLPQHPAEGCPEIMFDGPFQYRCSRGRFVCNVHGRFRCEPDRGQHALPHQGCVLR